MTMWTPKQTRRALALRTRPRAKTSLRIWRSKWSLTLFEFLTSIMLFAVLTLLLTSDYQEKPELDRYEADGLDDEGDHAELDYQQRREIERNMDQDARMRQQRGRRAGAFMDDNEYSENEEIARQMRMDRMKALHGDGNVAMEDDQEMNEVIDFEDVKGQVSQWVQKQEVIRWIRKTFGSFLRNFKDDSNTGVYEERIREMCSNNK